MVADPVPVELALPASAPATLPAALRANAATDPDGRALVASDAGGGTVRLTWAQLDARTDALARGLVAAGVEPGDRVALMGHNTVAAELVTGYYAIHKAGAICVPLNARFVAAEVSALLAQCGARALLAQAEVLDRLDPAVETVVAFGSDAWRALTAGGDAELPAVGPDDGADWLFTSGTTGRPKCVTTTHAGCVATGTIMRAAFGLVAGDVLQTPFPFYTSSGCHSSALSALLAGAAYVPDPEVDVAAVVRRLQAEGTTVLGAVPSVFTYMLEAGLLAGADVRRVRVLFTGGAAITSALTEQLLAAFSDAELTNVYGLTEAGNAGLTLPGRYARVKAGSIGREPSPWTAYRVQADDGSDVGPGGVGELLLRGPSIMAGYHDDPAATAEALRDGWLHTGDVVRLDEDGFVFVHDRKKDLIIRGGFNVSSLEVEDVLTAHPDVLEAAVVGKPHARLGEDVCAFVVPRGSALDVTSVVAFCADRLADFKVPRDVIVLDELPRNATGKLLKARLRERLRRDHEERIPT